VDSHPAVPSLIGALADSRDGLRQFAMRRLVSIGASAVPELILALKDSRDYMQESVAITLATMGQTSVPFLMEALKSKDRKICWAAAWVLSSMPPEVRTVLPNVKVAPPKPVSKHDSSQLIAAKTESGLHGVWSDAWLSKVRERLVANRMADVFKIIAMPNPLPN
jgi:HEAT repeat protein